MSKFDNDFINDMFKQVDDDWTRYFWLVEMGLIETAHLVYGMTDDYIKYIETSHISHCVT